MWFRAESPRGVSCCITCATACGGEPPLWHWPFFSLWDVTARAGSTAIRIRKCQYISCCWIQSLFVHPLISIRHDIGQCSIFGIHIQKLYFKNITTQIIHLNIYHSKHEATMLWKCQKDLYIVCFLSISLKVLATMISHGWFFVYQTQLLCFKK